MAPSRTKRESRKADKDKGKEKEETGKIQEKQQVREMVSSKTENDKLSPQSQAQPPGGKEKEKSLRAFFALLTSYAEAKRLRIPVDVRWFGAIDDDQTGKELLEELQEMTDKELQEMIDEMDIDGNGEISPSAADELSDAAASARPAKRPRGDKAHVFSRLLRGAGSIASTLPPIIKLEVRDQEGTSVFFKIKRETQLKNLMDAYCSRQAVARDLIVFFFNRKQIRPTQTVAELEMEDEDKIDAVLQSDKRDLDDEPPSSAFHHPAPAKPPAPTVLPNFVPVKKKAKVDLE